MSAPIVHTDPATGLPVGTAAVFLTLGAALVALYPTGATTLHGHPTFRWLCQGCGGYDNHPEQRPTARNKANDHAAECRAIPWPQPNSL